MLLVELNNYFCKLIFFQNLLTYISSLDRSSGKI